MKTKSNMTNNREINQVIQGDCLDVIKNTPVAQKEDRKECKHEGDKTDWHPQFCRKCGAEFMYDFLPPSLEKECWKPEPYPPTPSPLEIEEIEETSQIDLKDVHKLIRNQKKLYKYIKEKKI